MRLLQQPRPIMRGTTRFQPDPGRCQLGEELPHLAAPELTPDNRLLVLIDAVHLKDMLGGIQTNSDNRHGTAPFSYVAHSLARSMPSGAVHPNITKLAVPTLPGERPDWAKLEHSGGCKISR